MTQSNSSVEAVALPPEAIAAWVEYEPPTINSNNPLVIANGTLRHAFMAGFLASRASIPLPDKGVGQWQPIETAPKDGTRIYAADAARDHSGTMIFRQGEWELTGLYGNGLGIGFYPTHWMPLPPPPAIRALQDSEQ